MEHKALIKELTWLKTFMESTELFANHSKCAAKQVACLLIKNNNILSIGVNGTMSGEVNCNEIFKKVDRVWYKKNLNGEFIPCVDQEEHHKWSLIHEIHAEVNAISKANSNSVNVDGSIAIITHSPCFNCAKTLAAFGIKKIYYKEEYDGFELIKERLSGIIEVHHLPEMLKLLEGK